MMSLDIYFMTSRQCDQSVVHLNRAYAVREWITSRIGIPPNGRGAIAVTKEFLTELLESCNAILADHNRAESLIPINTNDFDPDQDYNDEYFDQIEETKNQLDNLFKTWKSRKPLYYFEWY
jgi:hypothetical protein